MNNQLSFADQKSVELLLKLSEIRKDKKITQKELANLTGIPQNKISNYENFRIFPKLDTLLKLTSALDVKISII